jgi:hypothetical protein
VNKLQTTSAAPRSLRPACCFEQCRLRYFYAVGSYHIHGLCMASFHATAGDTTMLVGSSKASGLTKK